MSLLLPDPSGLPATSHVIKNQTHFDSSAWLPTLFLQIAQRSASLALLATIGTWFMMYKVRDFHVPLAIAAACADAAFCSAMMARMITRSNTAARREANGVAVFSLILFGFALHLMIFARLEIIRSAAQEFFTPTQPAPLHG